MPYIKSQQLAELLAWSKQQSTPIVIKPLQSAGNDGVFFCQSEDELLYAFNKIIGSKNIFNQQNQAVLAQPLLSGTEYIVNCVSHRNAHRITDIWRCEKKFVPGKSNISMLEALVAPSDPVCQILSDYTKQVLAALHIAHGPSHLEIMLTKDGPILIECAARLQGCVDPSAVELATGHSQLSAMVMSYACPEKFIELPERYNTQLFSYRLFMQSSVSGVLQQAIDLTAVKAFPSYYSANICLDKGSKIEITQDIATVPGYMHFIHRDRQQLQQDYLDYRTLEKNQLFTAIST